MKNIIKISIATLATIIILGTSVIALTGTVNTSSGLVLRQEADKTSDPITTVPSQTQVDIIEKVGEWYKVNYNSQEGYLFAEYVNTNETPVTQPETPTETPEIPTNTQPEQPTTAEVSNLTNNNLKVYNIPLITSTVIDEIPANTVITVKKQITNWSYVSDGKIQGWVRTYAINGNINEAESEVEQPANENNETSEEPTPEEITPVVTEPENNETEETNTTVKTGTINVGSANVRKEATTSSEVLTTLPNSTVINIVDETEDWYKINYTASDGTVYNGYISKSLVTTR